MGSLNKIIFVAVKVLVSAENNVKGPRVIGKTYGKKELNLKLLLEICWCYWKWILHLTSQQIMPKIYQLGDSHQIFVWFLWLEQSAILNPSIIIFKRGAQFLSLFVFHSKQIPLCIVFPLCIVPRYTKNLVMYRLNHVPPVHSDMYGNFYFYNRMPGRQLYSLHRYL